MRRVLCPLLLAVFSLGLIGCSGSDKKAEPPKEEKPLLKHGPKPGGGAPVRDKGSQPTAE